MGVAHWIKSSNENDRCALKLPSVLTFKGAELVIFSPLPPFSFLMIHICKSTESPVNGKVGCGQRFSLLRRDEHGVE